MKTGGSKKNLWVALAAVSGVALIVCLVLIFLPKGDGKGGQSSSSDPYDAFTSSTSSQSSPGGSSVSGTADVPVDFAQWQERNADIYAWLSFPEADVEEPILCREGEDEYYLRKDLEGKYSIAGSLFTEGSYNGLSFADPVTMIYGHNMDDGTMFGKLETWAMQAELGEDTTFTIYQPGRELTYRIFAAVPYDNSHVMYYNDFSNADIFNQFFVDITDMRDLSARVDRSAKPTDGDKVVILSTCLTGDSNRRFLVMGVLTEDSNEAS